MRTYMCFPTPTGGIAELGNVFLIKAKNEKAAIEAVRDKSRYVNDTKIEAVDIGKVLKDNTTWSLWT